MSLRTAILLVGIACLHQATARPIRRTLNFNMFVLRPQKDAPDRVLLTTDGVSRFGPILEYLVQRVQGMISVRHPPEHAQSINSFPVDLATALPTGALPVADTAENEVDGNQETKMPGVIVRPSRTKPGTYEVEIDVLVDDGQPDTTTNQHLSRV